MRRISTILALVFLIPTAVASETLQAVDLDSGLFTQRTSKGWVVRQPQRAPVRLPLPADEFRPYQIVPTTDGWLVAGSGQRGDRHDLVILRYAEGRVAHLPRLPDPIGRVRIHPVLSMEDGQLLGVAWVEGDRQEEYVVRAAAWNGAEWGRVEEVSGPAPGAQLALASAVLANGDWLVLWSGFDGEDDEIVWSRRENSAWSRPLQLHADNRVPDITPTLLATETGAVAAWSVYDGDDYRLRLAHFDGDRWSVSPLRGAKGSIDPQALTRGGRYMVLHRTIIPDGWSLVDLDANATPIRHAAIDLPSAEPPLILPADDTTDDSGIQVAWPDEVGRKLIRSRPQWDVTQ